MCIESGYVRVRLKVRLQVMNRLLLSDVLPQYAVRVPLEIEMLAK